MPRVLHVAAEIFPYVKTGGLADVLGALPAALAAHGAEVRLLLPGMPAILDALEKPRKIHEFGPLFGAARITLLAGTLASNGLATYVIDSPWLYRRGGGPYQDSAGRDWEDNLQRFALLGWVAAHLAAGELDARWMPDIVHAHDWHAALACCYLDAHPGAQARSVFTIHNLAYQGVFSHNDFAALGLPARFMQPYGALEYHGGLSFMKGGLVTAQRITTVSPSYAREIMTAEFGCGLEGVIAARSKDLHGILNGVDDTLWDPSTDPHLTAHFSASDLQGKANCKLALQSEFGLKTDRGAPLFGVVSRLSAQKGLDLLRDALPVILESGGQLVMLGSGDAALQDAFRDAARAHPQQIGVRIGYDESLAHRIIAGADSILLPSRFEPCGLTQLYGLRYGTLPLVRRVGGLADTVDDAVGFSFLEPEQTLAQSLQLAVRLWRNDAARWKSLMQAAMARRHDWSSVAEEYAELYRELTAS